MRRTSRIVDRRTPYAQHVVLSPDLSPREALLVAARAAGCTCSPDIHVCHAHRRAVLAHDRWCGLLRRGDVN